MEIDNLVVILVAVNHGDQPDRKSNAVATKQCLTTTILSAADTTTHVLKLFLIAVQTTSASVENRQNGLKTNTKQNNPLPGDVLKWGCSLMKAV